MTPDVHRAEALRDLRDLEAIARPFTAAPPVFLADQWGAGVRDALRQLEAPLEDRAQARCAFAGAYLALSLATQGAALRPDALVTMTHLLRWLYDRGEEEDIAWPTID